MVWIGNDFSQAERNRVLKGTGFSPYIFNQNTGL